MSTSTRHSILETSLEVLVNDGVGALTLERVAREAGISKGGLLYHYEGKDQLLEGLIELLIEDLNREGIGNFMEETSSDPHARSLNGADNGRGATLQIQNDYRPLKGSERASILMAALAINPQLLEPIRDRYRGWYNASKTDGIDWPRPLRRATGCGRPLVY